MTPTNFKRRTIERIARILHHELAMPWGTAYRLARRLWEAGAVLA